MGSEDLKFIIEMVDKASAQIKGVQDKVESLGQSVDQNSKGINSSFSSMGRSVLGYVAAFASIGAVASFLKDSVTQALEAERAHAQLKRQVESTGVSWATYGTDIQKAIASAAKYAVVQDEEVSRALSRMMLVTGDVKGSVDNLRLALDLAAARGIDFEQAAMLVGKAMEGDITMLARFLPELKILETTLGDNATASNKSAASLTMLQQRVGGAAGTMEDGTRAIKELNLAWIDFKEMVGTSILPAFQSINAMLHEVGRNARIIMHDLFPQKDIEEKTGALKKIEDRMESIKETLSQLSQGTTKVPAEHVQKLVDEYGRLVEKWKVVHWAEVRVSTSFNAQGEAINKLNELTRKKIVDSEALKKAGDEEKARLEKLNGLYGTLNASLVTLGGTEADYLTGKIMENAALFKTSAELETYLGLLQEELSVKKEIKLQTMVEKERMADIAVPEGMGLDIIKLKTEEIQARQMIPPTFGEDLRALYLEHIQTPTEEMLDVSLSAMQTFAQGVGDAFANAIVYGESLSAAFSSLMKRIAADIIAGLVKIGVQQLLSSILGKAVLASDTSARLAANAAVTFAGVTAWAAPMLGPGALAVAKATTAAMLTGAVAAGAAGGALGKTLVTATGVTPMAKGGIVTSPTIALIGEAGPEAVVPLKDKGRGFGGGINITFTGPVMGNAQQAREFAQMIDEALFDLKNKNLSLAFA